MAESPLKRQREETQIEETDETKRHKSSSFNDILSLLDEAEEEEKPAQDLSSLMTSLQNELSSSSSSSSSSAADDSNTFDFDSIPYQNTDNGQETSNPSSCSSKDDEADDKERVMRHLLEASDDELGIPSMEAGVDNNRTDYDDDLGINSVDGLALCDGLWDLEDEAANYYTLLQSELFM